jgi:plasmid stabilization system protein ParE
MSFRFLPAAQDELLECIAHHADIQPALGARFEEAVAFAVRSAASHPERGAARSRNTRRWLVKGFPYAVLYRADDSGILVVAVAHERRHPAYWEQRLP